MADDILKKLSQRIGEDGFNKLTKIRNPALYQFITKYIELCNPDRVFVSTGKPEEDQYIREAAIRNGEEQRLAIEGHTVHFDNYYDQSRDRKNTGILNLKGVELDDAIETKDRDTAIKDIHKILKDIMKGKEMYICFFCLGPTHSEFSIPAVQITDSSYVAHTEGILYRHGYEEFVVQGPNSHFFKFVHSQGELDERKNCKNLDKRRIFIDLEKNIVYSTNTQYGGNAIGLKKLAMRLAIHRGSKEGWLTEHMLIMGVHGPKGRVTYFTGAFPSLCGKTSTAMLEGETIVGDDITYLRKKNGKVRAANAEKGMFGIIQDVNSKDDQNLWRALHKPGGVIFSNVLVTPDKYVHWIGKDGEVPPKGENHSGEWYIGKKDKEGQEIPCSHPNARFAIDLRVFDNLDHWWNAPEGVVIGGIVYGGRDSDIWVPVEESFDWIHGIITKGASLESETTAATLGIEGIREFSPMSNLDFLSIPVARYIQINANFARDLKDPPLIFSVNYFLKNKDGKFLNEKTDKRVWYKWMELRVHKEVEAIATPTGRIPMYNDLKGLFKDVLKKDYKKEDYNEQFTLRIPENLAKIERIENIYITKIKNAPKILFEVLEAQKERLLKCQKKYGNCITPDKL